jgi:hypothetical protein
MFLLTFLAMFPSSPTASASPALQGTRVPGARSTRFACRSQLDWNGSKSRGACDCPEISLGASLNHNEMATGMQIGFPGRLRLQKWQVLPSEQLYPNAIRHPSRRILGDIGFYRD